MDLDVTSRAILVSQARLVVKIRCVRRADLVRVAVTLQAELAHARTIQQLRIRRTVRRMTRRTAFHFQRRVLENEWSLLVRMTLQTTRVGASRQTRLFELKAAVWIVTIAALHQPFEHLVMKRPAKLGLRFTVTTDTELRFTAAQHVGGQLILISPRCFRYEGV